MQAAVVTDNQEKVLLKNLAARDIFTFEEVYKKYNKKIFNFSLRCMKNRQEAEEIVQEVFLNLWEYCQELRKDSNLNAWLFTVTLNAIRKRFRKRSVEKKHIEQYSARIESEYRNTPDILYSDLLDRATHIIDRLPSQQKRVFLLRKDKGLSSAEIAKELNLSKKTVENHLYRANAFLRKALKEEGFLTLLFFSIFIL